MRTNFTILILGLCIANTTNAASTYAGQVRAEGSCAQCHGLKQISADAPFPPLAGRDAAYLKTALQQYRDKQRPDPVMQAIAGSLTDAQIADVAAYYANLKP